MYIDSFSSNYEAVVLVVVCSGLLVRRIQKCCHVSVSPSFPSGIHRISRTSLSSRSQPHSAPVFHWAHSWLVGFILSFTSVLFCCPPLLRAELVTDLCFSADFEICDSSGRATAGHLWPANISIRVVMEPQLEGLLETAGLKLENWEGTLTTHLRFTWQIVVDNTCSWKKKSTLIPLLREDWRVIFIESKATNILVGAPLSVELNAEICLIFFFFLARFVRIYFSWSFLLSGHLPSAAYFQTLDIILGILIN